MESEGQLVFDPLLRRYKVVGLPGQPEQCLQEGEQLELFIEGRWIPVNLGLFGKAQDKWAWKFSTGQGVPVFPVAEQRARLVNVTQQQRR